MYTIRSTIKSMCVHKGESLETRLHAYMYNMYNVYACVVQWYISTLYITVMYFAYMKSMFIAD